MQVLNDNEIAFECSPDSYVCTHCQIGKGHKLPFNNSSTVYSCPLELIALDLWGPLAIMSDQRNMYYLFFINAYTRYTWIFFLKSKSETQNVTIQFITQIEKQTTALLRRFK